MQVPPFLREFIEKVTHCFPQVRAIWLFGSQLNDESGPKSDWDLLALADAKTLEQLRDDSSFRQIAQRDRIHLFVSPGGQDLFDPWGGNTLNLSEMNWTPDNGIAEYDHNKPLPGEGLEEAILRSATQNPR